MRLFPLVFLLFCLSMLVVGCGQSPPRAAIKDAPKADLSDTLDMRDFNANERKAWEEATKDWYKKSYAEDCLFAHGYKLNCTDCTNLGLRLQITVDDKGAITGTKELENKIYCHHTDEEDAVVHDCLMQSFPKVVLPEVFHAKVLIVFIGRVPSC